MASPRFTFPSDEHLVFYELDTLAVSYESQYTNASLWTFCWQDSTLQTKKIIRDATPLNGTQVVQIDYRTSSDDCWFNLRDDDSDDKGFNSVHFALSENQRSQTTLGLGSSSTGTLSMPTTTSTTSPTRQTSHGTATAEASHKGGLSSGARVGVGIVVAFSILALAGFLGAFIMQRRRRNAQPSSPIQPLMIMTPGSEKPPSLHELESPVVHYHHKHLPELPS